MNEHSQEYSLSLSLFLAFLVSLSALISHFLSENIQERHKLGTVAEFKMVREKCL